MMLDADMLADRHRLTRRVRAWRVSAVLAGLAAVIAVGIGTSDTAGYWIGGDHVARYVVEGVIVDSLKRDEKLEEIGDNSQIKALVLHINSPGGTTAGAEALYAAVRKVAAKKPVVAVLGTVAASGGYVVALAADHIVARGNTLTGSIGVIVQWAEVTELMDKIGVKMSEVKSSPLKAEPSPFSTTTPEEREAVAAMVRDSYEWFVGLVATRRPISAVKARELGDGRIYTGRQAQSAQLVDALGGEDVALAWLRKEKQIDEDLEVIDWSSESFDDLGLLETMVASGLRHLGLDGVASVLRLSGKTLRTEPLNLDGLVSVWHPRR